MKTHQKFLEFNGKNIIFLSVDGTYWIALKPILEVFNMDADSAIKKTKKDSFLGGCTSNFTVQVESEGIFQGRSMVCLPEKYIYGWICFLNSNSPELIEYKHTCYELLYNHFHGTITNRKELLIERNLIDAEIHHLKQDLKEKNEKFIKLNELQSKRKLISTELNSIDKELIKQPRLFN